MRVWEKWAAMLKFSSQLLFPVLLMMVLPETSSSQAGEKSKGPEQGQQDDVNGTAHDQDRRCYGTFWSSFSFVAWTPSPIPHSTWQYPFVGSWGIQVCEVGDPLSLGAAVYVTATFTDFAWNPTLTDTVRAEYRSNSIGVAGVKRLWVEKSPDYGGFRAHVTTTTGLGISFMREERRDSRSSFLISRNTATGPYYFVQIGFGWLKEGVSAELFFRLGWEDGFTQDNVDVSASPLVIGFAGGF